MLYTASDYKFVNATPVSNRINGNILPIVNPTSKTAQLYFENYLFLLEAYFERMNPEQEGQNNITVPVRTLNGGDIWALNLDSNSLSASGTTIRGPNLGYNGSSTYFISPDTTFPQNHINTGYSEEGSYHVYNYLSSWYNPCPERLRPYYDMIPRNWACVLSSDFIRAKFYAFEHMSKLLIGLYNGDWATHIVHYTYNADGSVSQQYDVSLNSSVIQFVRAYGNSTQYGQYQRFKTVVTYKSSFFTLPYATGATLIWDCGVASTSGSSSDTKYVWAAKPLSISNGAIQVPNNLLETLCDEACSICGRANTSEITFYGCNLIVDFEFPARLNGISWNWQPTYT